MVGLMKFSRKIIKNIKRLFSTNRKDIKGERLIFTKDIFCGDNYLIGEYTYGSPNVKHWGENAKLIIGRFSSIAGNVTIFLGGNHRTDWVTTYPFNVLNKNFENAIDIKGHPMTKGDVVIGNDVWIGFGATILSGIKIGNGAVIATQAVVTKDVPPYSIVAGNPATIVKKRFNEKTIAQLEQIAWWNWSTEKINQEVKNLCSNKIEEFINRNLEKKL
jgi:acetyltransferase-like isoleucine patch superfamily enzyme